MKDYPKNKYNIESATHFNVYPTVIVCAWSICRVHQTHPSQRSPAALSLSTLGGFCKQQQKHQSRLPVNIQTSAVSAVVDVFLTQRALVPLVRCSHSPLLNLLTQPLVK